MGDKSGPSYIEDRTDGELLLRVQVHPFGSIDVCILHSNRGKRERLISDWLARLSRSLSSRHGVSCGDAQGCGV